MNKRMILTLAFSALALIPPACVVESSKDDDDDGVGGSGASAGATQIGTVGGATSATGGASNLGGTGATNTTTTTTTTAANAGAAGSTPTASAGSGAVAGSAPSNVAGASSTTQNGGSGGAATTVPIVRTPVEVRDDIAQAQHWTADHVYIVYGTLYVSAALTIDPGTVVKFVANANMDVQATGQLNAIGTSALPIVFTSIKDDTGGDNNQDAAATQPGSGDWGSIRISGNSSKLEYCAVRYSSDGLELSAKNLSIKNTTFASNGQGIDASSCDPSLALSGNVFFGNETPIYVKATIPVDASNSFHSPSDANQKNKYQCIFVNDDVDQAVTWSNTELAYCVNGTTYVENPAALTLASGVVVKFAANASMNVQNGGTLNGADTAIFTSIKDDAHLGDANGDAAATTPAAEDWDGVYISATDTTLSGSNVLYGTP